MRRQLIWIALGALLMLSSWAVPACTTETKVKVVPHKEQPLSGEEGGEGRPAGEAAGGAASLVGRPIPPQHNLWWWGGGTAVAALGGALEAVRRRRRRLDELLGQDPAPDTQARYRPPEGL